MHAEPYRQQGLALYKLGRYNEAHATLKKSIHLTMKSPCAWFYLGKVLQKCGYIKHSMKAYKVALLYDNRNKAYFKKLDGMKKAYASNADVLNREPMINLEPPLLPLDHLIKK
jgi:tetratricopeptide (TPR) repeat protein